MRELTEGHMTIETPRELAEYAASVLAGNRAAGWR
jgi:hypothetical protein